MARLTNDMRNSFVTAVLADVTDGGLEEQLHKVVRKAYMQSVPKVIIEAMKLNDVENYINVRSLSFNTAPPGEHAWDYYRTSIGGLPCSGSNDPTTKDLIERFPDVAQAWAAWREFYENKRALETKLQAVAASCSNTQKLIAALPELEKYLPTEATVSKDLPATNEVAVLLSTLGWKETP